jgi:2-haloacid dehalogenase
MLDFRRYAALTFDCYGTLIDWESGMLPILERWAERSSVESRGDALLEAFAKAETQAEAEHPSMLYPDILRTVMKRLAEYFGVTHDEAAANQLAQSIGEWPAFSDSGNALRSLKRHYKLAIISNVDRASFARSNQRLGVDFDLIVTAQDVGSYKPNLRNFETVLGRLGALSVGKDSVLHVAQSLYHDHVPAKKLGLASVWINRRQAKLNHGATLPPESPVIPDAEYPSMQAFAEAVEDAFANPGGRQ